MRTRYPVEKPRAFGRLPLRLARCCAIVVGVAAVLGVADLAVPGMYGGRVAFADTVTLQDGRVIEGRVKADRAGEPVEFRAYGVTVRIPRDRIRGEIEKTRRDNITTPGGNAEADEFCEAGDAYLKNGDVDDAYTCFVQAFERDPTNERAARGALRAAIEGTRDDRGRRREGIAESAAEARERWFELDRKLRLGDYDADEHADALRAVERARAGYERIVDAFEPYKAGLGELSDFAGWITLVIALELREGRDDAVHAATKALDAERKALCKIVDDAAAIKSPSDVQLARFARQVDERRREVLALVIEPGSPDALLRLRDYCEPVHMLLALMDVARRYDVELADTLDVSLADWTGEWRATLPTSAVAANPKLERVQLNAAIREANADLLDDLVDARSLSAAAKAVFIALNDYRELMGLLRLMVDSSLMRACRDHLEDLAGQAALSHEGRGGSTPDTRAERAGFKLGSIGENLYQGERDLRDAEVGTIVASVLGAWRHSPKHHLNLLRESHTFMGIATSRQNQRWAALLGARG